METVNQRGCTDNAVAAGTPPAVVCLDDDLLVESVFLAAAARAGVRGVFVTNAGAFECAVRTLAPRAVVIDQVMPDCTGAELILWLRGLADPPCVIAIGSDPLYVDTAAALVRGAGLRAAAALRKPLRLAELVEAMRVAVGAAARRSPE